MIEGDWQWGRGLAEEYNRWKGEETWSLTTSSIEHAVSMATQGKEKLAWAITTTGSLTFEAHIQRSVVPAFRDCNEQSWILVKKSGSRAAYLRGPSIYSHRAFNNDLLGTTIWQAWAKVLGNHKGYYTWVLPLMNWRGWANVTAVRRWYRLELVIILCEV